MRTAVRWILRGITAVIAAAGAWLALTGVSSVWLAGTILLPWPAIGLGRGFSVLMGGFFLVSGIVFTAAGLALLTLAWSMSGLPRPSRLQRWLADERVLRRWRRVSTFTADLDAGMSQRRLTFQHDGHQFDAVEQVAARGVASTEALAWTVSMDGEAVLDIAGGDPVRAPDVVKHVVEWYEIQQPRGDA